MSVQWVIIVLIVAMFVGWLIGIIFYAKYLDKPETSQTIEISQIKKSELNHLMAFDPEKMQFTVPQKPRKIKQFFNKIFKSKKIKK